MRLITRWIVIFKVLYELHELHINRTMKPTSFYIGTQILSWVTLYMSSLKNGRQRLKIHEKQKSPSQVHGKNGLITRV